MPLDTVLLLDTSGSMAGRGMRELKRACNIFMDGVEETARQTGLKENVGIVEFNQSSKVVQSLTNDYARCRRAINLLNVGGQTAMFDGLMTALKEIVENGGVLRIAGIPMTPRIILMTDGKPTDSGGEEEAQKKVLKAAISFGPGWKLVGLPYPVPIACVGCGADCDPSLLRAIAQITKGMFVIVENIAELSTFFRRQVLLIRFAAKFASDMERLRSQLALAAFLQELGEAVEEAEVAAMQRLLLAMLHMSGDEDSDDDESGAGASQRPSGATPRAIAAGPSSSSSSSYRPSGLSGPSTSGATGGGGVSSSAVVRPSSSSGQSPPARIIVQQRLVQQQRVFVARPPGPMQGRPPPSRQNGSGRDEEECVIQ